MIGIGKSAVALENSLLDRSFALTVSVLKVSVGCLPVSLPFGYIDCNSDGFER